MAARQAAVELPECPICMEVMTAPIFQCQSGHSLCSTCTQSLMPPMCPICRQAMTQMRNWQLEEIIAKAKVPCPNKAAGCTKTAVAGDVTDHLSDCIFRVMDCPLGSVFGRCSWNGKLNEMMDHFKERHPDHSNVSSDADVELTNVNIQEDDRHVYLIAQAKLLFLVTMKIDTLQKMVYWTVQHIGSKKVAHQHIYEIHVNSKQDARRKVVFTEHCFNDSVKADEIFRQGKCGILPLGVLSHFIKDKSMSFRFFIKRLPVGPPKNKGNDEDGNNNDNKPSNKGPKWQSPKGPGPHPKGAGTSAGPKGPGHQPKGPGHHPKTPGSNAGPKGHFQKGPGPKKFQKA